MITIKLNPLRRRLCSLATLSSLYALASLPASADTFAFSTGKPDGLIGTLSRPANGGTIQAETADDFVLRQSTNITSARFFGLIPSRAALSSISQIEIEFYHVFPGGSVQPPSGRVLTRFNSPGDVEIGSATRDSAAGGLTYGEGPATGEEVEIDVSFTKPVALSRITISSAQRRC